MKRIVIPIVAAIAVFSGIFYFFFQKGVTADIDMPEVIEAGGEITVTVTLNKGNLTNFARFQQDIPAGLSVKAGNSANADFSFEDQKLRLIWLNLPTDEKVTFTYIITADERLQGNTELGGQFSYIVGNERQSINLKPVQLSIMGSTTIDPSLIVDIDDFKSSSKSKPKPTVATTTDAAPISQQTSESAATATPSPATVATSNNQIASIRQQQWFRSNNAYMVTVLINKNAMNKTGVLEERLPAGFKASDIDSKGATFTFEKQKAKFAWNVLPTEPYFVVKYKIVPDRGYKVKGDKLALTGLFSYLDGDKTMNVETIEQSDKVEGLSQSDVNILIAKNAPVAPTVGITAVAPTQQPPATTAGASEQEVAVAQTTPETQTSQTSTDNAQVEAAAQFVTEGDEADAKQFGIYFKVQIAAGHRPVNVKRYFGRYNLDYEVNSERHDGWYKYCVGNFLFYKEARDYRAHLHNATNLGDAFVTAYNSGRRITVQEALMAANQKWLK